MNMYLHTLRYYLNMGVIMDNMAIRVTMMWLSTVIVMQMS